MPLLPQSLQLITLQLGLCGLASQRYHHHFADCRNDRSPPCSHHRPLTSLPSLCLDSRSRLEPEVLSSPRPAIETARSLLRSSSSPLQVLEHNTSPRIYYVSQLRNLELKKRGYFAESFSPTHFIVHLLQSLFYS